MIVYYQFKLILNYIMFNPLKIKFLINDRKLSDKNFSMKEFCRSIILTDAALRAIIERGAIPKVNTLESIAKYFGVDMNYFFNIETKKPEVESVSVRMTDGNEYMLKRFEEVVAENALHKKKVEELNNRVKELEGIKKYTVPTVQDYQVADTPAQLKKK